MPKFSLDTGGHWIRADGTVVSYCSRSCAFVLEARHALRRPASSITRESRGELVELDGDDEFRLGAAPCMACGEAVPV